MLVQSNPESTTLYYCEGASDKVYHVALEPSGDQFVVNFAYGRRGSALSTGCKTACPVDYEEAKRVYDKSIREKKAKGYTPGPSGRPHQHTEKAGRFTGLLPQLLNPVEEPEVHRLSEDPAWCFQPKYDGRRLLIQKIGQEVTAINRKGLIVELTECLIHAALLIRRDFLLDGEAVGLVYYAFDLLELDGGDCRLLPMQLRFERLTGLLPANAHPFLSASKVAWNTEEKTALLASLRQSNHEGVVFKEVEATYQPGRPNTGGPALKHKFYATLSAVVRSVNQKRSVQIGLFGSAGWQTAGNVTVPPSGPLPKVGDVVEVRYLYAFPQSGVLYQPVFLGVRSDLSPSDCSVTQLKFKSSQGDV